MTSPPGNGTPIVPGKGYTAQTIYQLQNVDPDALGAASNLDLWEMLENFRNKLLTDLLGGFASVPIAILDGIGDVISAITGILHGDFDDLHEWAQNVIAGFGDLLAALQGKYTGTDSFLLQIQKWAGGLFAWVQDVADFVQNLLDAILRGIRGIPVVGGAIADVISDLTGLKNQADGTKAGIVQGWSGGSTAGADTDVYDTLAQVKSFAEGGYTVETKTSSGSWTVPANLKELIVIGIGGGGGGNKGAYAYQQASGTFVQGGAGGYGGSYLATQIDLNVLPAAGGTVSYTVGAGGAGNGGVGGDASATAIRNGGTTSFGSWMSVNCDTGKQIATLLGYQATTSGPGSGGQGGDATAVTSAAAGQNGVSTQQAVGGDGGVAQFGGSSGNAANGGNGGNASPAAATKTGGAGGGGGGARHVHTLATSGNGGNGGNGGYPGGGGGGGGACYRTNTSAGGSAGNGGVGAAGILWIMWR